MLILFLILFVLFPKHKRLAIVALILVAVIVSMALSGKIEVITTILERFSNGDITTGRADLNSLYLTYVWENPMVLLFGSGISTDRIIGASNNVHNIYIEGLFKLGIVGCVIYICTLLSCILLPKKSISKRKFVNFLPLIFVAILYFALAGIIMYELPFYLAIAFLSVNFNSLDENELRNIYYKKRLNKYE